VSAPLTLNADQLRILADALDRLTKLRLDLDVTLTPYTPLHLGIGDSTVEIGWDGNAYTIDDRNGA